MHMNTTHAVLALGALGAMICLGNQSMAAAADIDGTTLAKVKALYGVSEQEAITRLAKEDEAARLDRIIQSMQLPGYAGSWFDGSTMTLQVATSDQNNFASIKRLGGTPVLVAHNLYDLEQALRSATAALENDVLTAGVIRKSYVDVRANLAVIGVASDYIARAASVIGSQGLGKSLVRIDQAKEANFSSNVRGADGTRNYTWHQVYGGTYPCSIGASIVGGYVTAGHCGSQYDVIHTPSGASLGVVGNSTYHNSSGVFDFYEDGSYVNTSSGWTPTPQVNGYSDGTLYVDGKWSGTLEASVGATVCRYGQTSGGPHCAAVTAKNVDVYFATSQGPVLIKGLTEVDGMCTDDGDSGGTVITPADQMQGTNSGGSTAGMGSGCPDDSNDKEYFQPIETTLSRFGKIMLTTHGANKPTINQFVCPNPGSSGNGQYRCYIDSYDSQGETSVSWTSNTGDSSTSRFLFGHCGQNQTVNVNLSVTNPYGTSQKSASFACPTGPLP